MKDNIQKRKYSLEEFSELGPGLVHINQVDDFVMNLMNRYDDKNPEKSMKEIRDEGAAFVEKLFEPDSIEFLSQPLMQIVQTDDETNVLSFFQKVRQKQHVDYSWLLSTSKILKGNKEFISVSQVLANEDNATSAINRLLNDNFCLRKKLNKFEALTKREKQILRLVAGGYSTKNIAEQLFLSPYTVSTHRKNIKQKLKIQSLTDWQKYADVLE